MPDTKEAYDAFLSHSHQDAETVQALAKRRAIGLESSRELTERMLMRVFSNIADYGGDVSLDVWVLGQCGRVLASPSPDSRPREHAPETESCLVRKS